MFAEPIEEDDDGDDYEEEEGEEEESECLLFYRGLQRCLPILMVNQFHEPMAKNTPLAPVSMIAFCVLVQVFEKPFRDNEQQQQFQSKLCLLRVNNNKLTTARPSVRSEDELAKKRNKLSALA